jgi:hypothetical protein
MVEIYVKIVEEHQRKVILMHQREWDEKPPLFLLAHRALTHKNIGTMPASMVFGRQLSLPCDLLFGALPDKE